MNICMLRRKLTIVFLCMFGTLSSLFLREQWISSVARGRTPKHENITILLWHWPFGRSYSLSGDVCWDTYKIPGCLLTDKHTDFPRADVVVFHHHELKLGRYRLPLHLPRPPTQKWLWLSLESPATNHHLAAYNGLFNWTMTYRRDADVFMPYGELLLKTTSTDINIHGNKSSLACWVVSNYRPEHKRSNVYQNLRHLINIDVYGQWVRRHLSAQDLIPTISHCFFYLAFENSLYTDYITEKLWRNSFQAGTVPIVLGPPRSNYEALVPASSFIHVEDFSSFEELAHFLEQLASDRKRYLSYFEWRRQYDVKIYTDWRERLCNICRHYHHLPPKVYHNLDTWANWVDQKTGRTTQG
ncbi:alpha-(1,3)-fucosyltransferase 7 [Megalops cyprinoides]|uniref:alpha-(1,3)-fucosyltransferase 7 n=1 Tax=Megalops cyprinoides TaxID=118141 RepID=UPI001863E5CE|nr:alpha-(1,3)-fucosyltransferase 7 [Megalops cyprinoides]